MATWDDVRRLALALPETAERTSHGTAAWSVGGRNFLWERPLRASDLEALGDAAPAGDILGIRTADLEMKEALIASNPKVFFTTPHFDGYAAVLAQLGKMSEKTLSAVVLDAWFSSAPKRVAASFAGPRPTAQPARKAARAPAGKPSQSRSKMNAPAHGASAPAPKTSAPAEKPNGPAKKTTGAAKKTKASFRTSKRK